MATDPEDWRSPATSDLLEAILALPDLAAAERFFRDLCTLKEIHDLAQRWQVVQLLDLGRHYGEISRETGASTATITRVAQWLHHGTGGYREALERGAGVAARTR
jgi:TrpR-related protein YerC/YecD